MARFLGAAKACPVSKQLMRTYENSLTFLARQALQQEPVQ